MNKEKEMIERLQNSPMFQLSLASKELFHSNFLYWLWKAEGDIFWSVMNYFGIERDNEIVVRREWENFDLSLVRVVNRKKRECNDEVEYVADVVAVIENKVKSLPRMEQLEEYNGKIKAVDKDSECTKILLSLPNPSFSTSVIGWRYVRYEDYLSVLRTHADKATTCYTKALVEDYCSLIDALCAMKDEWLCHDDREFLDMQYSSILNSDTDKEMRELRINDVRHKIIYSKMCELLCKRLVHLGEKVACDSALTRSIGLISCRITTRNGAILEYGIQVQGCQYRRFVAKRSSRVSDDDCINQITSSFPTECFKKPFVHNGMKKIGSYGEGFKYLYTNINDNITINDIVTQIAVDIEYLTNRYGSNLLEQKEQSKKREQ